MLAKVRDYGLPDKSAAGCSLGTPASSGKSIGSPRRMRINDHVDKEPVALHKSHRGFIVRRQFVDGRASVAQSPHAAMGRGFARVRASAVEDRPAGTDQHVDRTVTQLPYLRYAVEQFSRRTQHETTTCWHWHRTAWSVGIGGEIEPRCGVATEVREERQRGWYWDGGSSRTRERRTPVDSAA